MVSKQNSGITTLGSRIHLLKNYSLVEPIRPAYFVSSRGMVLDITDNSLFKDYDKKYFYHNHSVT